MHDTDFNNNWKMIYLQSIEGALNIHSKKDRTNEESQLIKQSLLVLSIVNKSINESINESIN